jgi:selenocysteine lyase/cysteine desulfurase
VDELIDAVREAGGEILSPVEPAERAGIVSFRLPGTDPAAVAKTLHAHDVTPSVRADSVRLSAHASTTAGAVDRVREALRSVGAVRA